METEEQLRRLLRRNTWLYYAWIFVNNFLLWSGIWIKYLISDRGLELRWILAMDFPFWILVALLQAPTGALADHIGRRQVLALSGVLYAITILGFGLTTNYWMLFFDYIIWAFAMAMQGGTLDALLFDTLKAAGKPDLYQKLAGRAIALSFVAGFSALLLGGFVAEKTSLAFTIQLSALAPVATVLIAWACIEPARAARSDRHYIRDLKAAFHFGWTNRQVRYTLLIGSVLMTATFGPVVLIQPFLIDYDVPTRWFSAIQAPLRIVTAFTALTAFIIARRLGLARLLVTNYVLVVGAYAGLAFIGHVGAFALFALPSLVAGLSTPAIGAHLNARIPSDNRATVLSLLQLAMAVQVAFFEPALGFFTDGISLTAAFVFAGLYFLVLMPPLLILWRRAHGIGPSQDAERIPALAPSPGG